jgi:hypothetical protein
MKPLKNLTNIIIHDIILFVKSGAVIILGLILALLTLAFYTSLPHSIFESGSVPKVKLALVNPDHSNYGKILYDMLNSLPEISELTWCEKDEAEELLEQGTVSVIAEMPEGIVDALVYNEPAAIKIISNDSLLGASTYSVTVASANTMNLMQTAVYEYYKAARPLIKSDMLFNISYNKFCLDLISDAVSRDRFINTEDRGINPYTAQLICLMLFMISGCCALCAGIYTTDQKLSAQIRRIKIRSSGFTYFFLGRLTSSMLAGLLFLCFFALIIRNMETGLNLFRLVEAGLLLMLILTPVFLMIAMLSKSSGHTALIGLSLHLLLLFAGGGFYPPYLMNINLLRFNPALLTLQMTANWAAGGAFPGAEAFASLCPAVICVLITAYLWHRESGYPKSEIVNNVI